MKLLWVILVLLVAGALMKFLFSLKSAKEHDEYADGLEETARKQKSKGLNAGIENYYINAKKYRGTANNIRISFFVVGLFATLIITVIIAC